MKLNDWLIRKIAQSNSFRLCVMYKNSSAVWWCELLGFWKRTWIAIKWTKHLFWSVKGLIMRNVGHPKCYLQYTREHPSLDVNTLGDTGCYCIACIMCARKIWGCWNLNWEAVWTSRKLLNKENMTALGLQNHMSSFNILDSFIHDSIDSQPPAASRFEPKLRLVLDTVMFKGFKWQFALFLKKEKNVFLIEKSEVSAFACLITARQKKLS